MQCIGVSSSAGKVIRFRVKNPAGDTSCYQASSVAELRVKVATRSGVLSPCIGLFSAVSGAPRSTTPIEDCFTDFTYSLPEEDFDDDHKSLEEEGIIIRTDDRYVALVCVKYEEHVKRHVITWSAEDWLRIIRRNLRVAVNASERRILMDYVVGLKRLDPEFNGKMHTWIRGRIDDKRTQKDGLLGEYREEIKILATLGGVNLDTTGSMKRCNRTLLHIAANFDQLEIVLTLLGAGVNKDVTDNFGCTPLYWAAWNGCINSVRALLNAGADLSKGDTKNGVSPLHAAAYGGHESIVKELLLKPGVDVDARDNAGRTALHCASSTGKNIEVIHILMHAGAEVGAMNRFGNTPCDVSMNGKCRRALRGEKPRGKKFFCCPQLRWIMTRPRDRVVAPKAGKRKDVSLDGNTMNDSQRDRA